MRKKHSKKQYHDTGLPPIVLALLGVIPTFLFGFLLLAVIEEKAAKYEAVRASVATPEYQLPQIYYQEQKLREGMKSDFERLNKNTREQMKQIKTQRAFNPF